MKRKIGFRDSTSPHPDGDTTLLTPRPINGLHFSDDISPSSPKKKPCFGIARLVSMSNTSSVSGFTATRRLSQDKGSEPLCAYYDLEQIAREMLQQWRGMQDTIDRMAEENARLKEQMQTMVLVSPSPSSPLPGSSSSPPIRKGNTKHCPMDTDEPSTDDNVHTLPNEIWTLIFSFLKSPDIISVRLVCRDWRSISLSQYRSHSVVIPNLQQRVSDELSFLSTHCPRLRSLDLSSCAALKSLPIASLLSSLPTSLETLNLAHLPISGTNLSLIPYATCTSLTTLILSGNRSLNSITTWKVLSQFSNLTALDLSYCSLLRRFIQSPLPPTLKSLDLGNNKLDSIHFLPNSLIWLNLARNRLSLDPQQPLVFPPLLQHLDLRFNWTLNMEEVQEQWPKDLRSLGMNGVAEEMTRALPPSLEYLYLNLLRMKDDESLKQLDVIVRTKLMGLKELHITRSEYCSFRWKKAQMQKLFPGVGRITLCTHKRFGKTVELTAILRDPSTDETPSAETSSFKGVIL